MPPLHYAGIPMEKIPDLIMHLLFLGLVKAFFHNVQSWAAKEGKAFSLSKFGVGLLEAIRKLNVSWCRPQPYKKGTCGGWVSEDFVFLSKLLPWFLSTLRDMPVTEEDVQKPYDPDPKNKNCWTGVDCGLWLKLRGYQVSKENAAWKQDKVHELMTQEGGPPERNTGKPSIANIELCVSSFYTMIASLMTKETTAEIINDCACNVRIFLTAYSRFDAEMPKKSTARLPSSISKGNFLSLLRLVDSMELLGPPRLNWEGNAPGEGSLKFVKKEIMDGNRENWHVNTLRRICSRIGLWMTEQGTEWARVNRKPKSEKLGYHRYKKEELLTAFVNNEPISGVVMTGGEIAFCLKTRNERIYDTFLPFQWLAHIESINSFAYHSWGDINVDGEPLPGTVKEGLLFLPRLCPGGFVQEPKGIGNYAVITEEWRVLSKDNEFVVPSFVD